MVNTPANKLAGADFDPGRSTAVASMVENVVGCKWSLRVLGLIASGKHRPSVLLRACPGLSAKVLNERLRKLVRLEIVDRTVHGDKPPVEVEYRLTPFGRRFMGIIHEIEHLQRDLDRNAFDLDGQVMKHPPRNASVRPSTRSGRPTVRNP